MISFLVGELGCFELHIRILSERSGSGPAARPLRALDVNMLNTYDNAGVAVNTIFIWFYVLFCRLL